MSGSREGAVALDPAELQRLAGVARVLIRRAVLTDAALPDREKRFLRAPRSAMPEPLAEHNLSYDSEGARAETARAARFRPDRADVERWPAVMAWLAWLKGENDGKRDVEILVRRSFGEPLWRLGGRFRRSDETIRRWEAAAVAAIVNRFWREIAALAPIDAESARDRSR